MLPRFKTVELAADFYSQGPKCPAGARRPRGIPFLERQDLAEPTSNDKEPRLSGKRGKRRGPRSVKQHIMRRLLVVIPASVLMIVLMKAGVLDVAADKMTFNKLAWFDDTKLVEHLRVLVTHNGMTSQPGKCLVFIVNGNDPPQATRIDVMAKHIKGCPEPDKEPEKLFTIRVDKADRELATDQGTPGKFRPMKTS